MKIYFHIGQKKTGTSAIQSFLNFNREQLAHSHKILYPNFSLTDMAKGRMHNHAAFYISIFRILPLERVTKFNECLSFANSQGIEKIVLSAENIDFQWLPGVLAEITEILNIDATIILYLRRQDQYLQAAWKQWGHKTTNVKTIQEFEKILDMDWHKILLPWMKHFVPEQFIIRPYEKSIIGNDVVADFMKIIGVKDLHGFVEPLDNNLNQNNGLNNDVIEVLRLCNHMVKDVSDHSLLDFIYNSLPDYYKKQPMTDYAFLSPIESLKIIEQYSISNNNLASIFWGENAVLFNDPLPDPNEPWEHEQGLTLEKVIPIFMEIVFNLHKQIKSRNSRTQIFDCFKFVNIELSKVFNKARITNQICGLNITETGLELVSEGNDPYFFLHKSLLVKRMKAIRIEITAPGPAILQVFYKTRILQGFNETNSVHKPLKEGRNILNLLISLQGVSGSLRIDPGNIPGKFIIHKIMIGS